MATLSGRLRPAPHETMQIANRGAHATVASQGPGSCTLNRLHRFMTGKRTGYPAQFPSAPTSAMHEATIPYTTITRFRYGPTHHPASRVSSTDPPFSGTRRPSSALPPIVSACSFRAKAHEWKKAGKVKAKGMHATAPITATKFSSSEDCRWNTERRQQGSRPPWEVGWQP